MSSKARTRVLVSAAVTDSVVSSHPSVYATYEGDVPPKTEIHFGDKTICLTDEAAFFDKDDKGRNVYSIIGQDMGITEGWIMGDPLFESAVTTFDRDHNRVGFSDYAGK